MPAVFAVLADIVKKVPVALLFVIGLLIRLTHFDDRPTGQKAGNLYFMK